MAEMAAAQQDVMRDLRLGTASPDSLDRWDPVVAASKWSTKRAQWGAA
jgi:hypothetical protein